jgi:hypothetical protein
MAARRNVSLCLANGHTEPHKYPLGWLGDEAELIIQAQNNKIVTEAHLTQLAVASILSKEAGKAFTKELKALMGE